jgi:hypothetical protein
MTRPHHNLFAFISFVLLLVITCDVEPNENERSLSSKSLDQPTEEKSKAPGSQETEIPEDEEIVLKKLKEYRAKKQKQTAQSVETSTYHRSIDDLDQERKNFEAAQRAFREVCMFVAPLLFLSCVQPDKTSFGDCMLLRRKQELRQNGSPRPKLKQPRSGF